MGAASYKVAAQFKTFSRHFIAPENGPLAYKLLPTPLNQSINQFITGPPTHNVGLPVLFCSLASVVVLSSYVVCRRL